MNKFKIAFFSIHPAPYRDPFLAALSEYCGIELHVYSYQDIDFGHNFWNLPAPRYSNTVLKSVTKKGVFSTYHWSLFKIIFSRYNLYVFPGFLHLTSVIGALLCFVLHKKYVISADTVADSESSILKKALKQKLIKNACFLFVPGKASVHYFRKRYQYPSGRICIGAYALDTVALASEIEMHKKQRLKIRQEYGILDKDIVFLMVANMIKSRGYPILAKAFSKVSNRTKQVKFMMIGKGEDYELIEAMCHDNPNLMCISGCSFERLKELYAISDVYVHGGEEPASTALAIGAIAGLPLLSSYAIGHAYDVLVDGETGVVVDDFGSENAWYKGITRLLSMQVEWGRYGSNAKKLVEDIGVKKTLERFCLLLK